jgi:hypothetical protein
LLILIITQWIAGIHQCTSHTPNSLSHDRTTFIYLVSWVNLLSQSHQLYCHLWTCDPYHKSIIRRIWKLWE